MNSMNDGSAESSHDEWDDEDFEENKSLLNNDPRNVDPSPRPGKQGERPHTSEVVSDASLDGMTDKMELPHKINDTEEDTGMSEESDSVVSQSLRSSNKTPCFVYMLTFLSAIGGFLFGYDTGVVAGALLLIRDEFYLSSVWQEVFISVTMGFAAVFAIVGGVLNDRFGRKPTIILASVVFTCGAVLLGVASQRWMLIAGRSILGIGIGFASSTVAMYIAECAPSHLRGQLVTLNNAFITGGQFVASIVDGGFSNKENGWRFMLGLAAVPSVVQFFGFLFMPETPRFLMMKKRKDEARHLLVRIRGQNDVEQELDEIEKDVQESEVGSSYMRLLTVPHVRRALFVGCMLQIFQQITGINTVMYYSATIIRMSGVSSTSSAIWLASITAAVNFVFTFVGLCLVDKIGRRPLTLGSLTGTMISLIVLAIGFQLTAYNSPPVDVTDNFNMSSSVCSNYTTCNSCMLDDSCGYCYALSPNNLAENGSCLGVPVNANGDHIADHSQYGPCSQPMMGQMHWAYGFCPSSYSWMTTFGLILYLVFFAPGMGPMPWTINSEIYPIWARSKGNSIATFCNWVANLAISMTFLTLTEVMTRYGAFYMYSAFALIGIFFIALCLPETKGKQLEEVEELFQRPLVSCGKNNQYTSIGQ